MDKRGLLVLILFSLLSFNLSAKYDKWNDGTVNEQQESSDSVVTTVEIRQKICKTHYNSLSDTDKLRYIQVDDDEDCEICRERSIAFGKKFLVGFVVVLILNFYIGNKNNK